ncbi:MAG: glycosyltransferase [Pirellulales bacterium]
MTTEPLRVILISTARKFHGGEQQAELLMDGLAKIGHECLTVVPNGSVYAERLERSGRPYVAMYGKGLSWRGAFQLRRAIEAHRPDAVLLNDPHALTAWQVQIVMRRFWRWSGWPWREVANAPGGSSSGAIVGRGPHVFAARRVDFPLNRPKRYENHCDGLLCVSHAIAQQCQRDGIPADKLFVVHDGVDPRRMIQGDAQRGRDLLQIDIDSGPILVCVARLADHKGHKYLLEAFASLSRRFPRSILALAGDGELRDSLQQLSGELGIADRVRFLGYTERIPDLLAVADLTVMASHMEGLCSSLIDSMFARCPIVATTAGGIPDLLAPRKDDNRAVGWLVPVRDSAALAEAMLDALINHRLRAEYVEAAYERAERSFTDAAMVRRTEQILLAAREGDSSGGEGVRN